MTIHLHPRLALAAAITPLALLAVGCGDDSGDGSDAASDPTTSASSEPTETTSEPTTGTTEPTQTATDAPTGIDYVVDGVWHQADGDTVDLPEDDYFGAVIWNDQLVATRSEGEAYAAADVIADDGTVVDTFDTTAGVVVNEAGTTIAWVDTSGEVMTAWEGDQVSMGTVDLSAPGETIAYFPAAITGGPDCYETADGCVVYVNSGIGDPRVFDSHGVNDNPLPGIVEFGDVSGDLLVTYTASIDDDGSCGGLADLRRPRSPRWEGCDFEAAEISPDSTHVIGLPSYYDGLGPTEISVLDAETGEETGRFAPEGGFVSQGGWSADGQLVFETYDGAQWHLFSMTTTGELTEIAEPVEGPELNGPFTVIQH